MWLYFTERLQILDPRRRLRLLEIAPKQVLSRHLSGLDHIEYIAGDLAKGRALNLSLDITSIPFSDETFDAVYCSHVFEHVVEDRKAMREIFRILNPTGWAVLQVPILFGATHTKEGPSITSPEAREREFGQKDHVRHYALDDYVSRLEEAGFSVSVDRFAREMPAERRLRLGIVAHEPVVICVKQSPAPVS